MSDAPSRLQEQHQPQVQVVHPTDEPAQFGACLARACEYSASNGTNQREFVPSRKETLCRRRCRTLRVDTGMMRTLEANRPSLERALIARERSERNHARLSSLEKDMRRIQAQEAASDATTQSETETIPRRQRDLSRRSRSTATIVGVPQCDRRSSQWVEPLTTWSSRPSDSGELRYILPEVRELVGTPRRKIVTGAEIGAATSTWMENELMRRNPTSSERLLTAPIVKHPSFGRHGAHELPETWRSLLGWQRLSPGRSMKPWVRAVWSQGSRADWWSKASMLWDCW